MPCNDALTLLNEPALEGVICVCALKVACHQGCEALTTFMTKF